MTRMRRFDDHRFVGTRDDMVVYDTDDAIQSEALAARAAAEDLLDRNLFQTFGPDDLAEARNRGFAPPLSG